MALLFRAAIVSLSSLLAAACSASYPTAPTKAAPVALMVHFSPYGRVAPGSSFAFDAYSLDTDGVYELVTTKAAWVSSDPNVMRQTSRPSAFLSVAPGATQITARYEGLETSVWMVVIDPQLQTFPVLSLNRIGPGAIGGSFQATAMLQRSANAARENITSRVTWTSANTDVATVDHNGVIRAVGIGTTLITAWLDDLTDWYWLAIPPRP